MLIARELRRYGYEVALERVETAHDMAAALDRQRWDVVLADYRLPNFSGPLALETVKQRGLDIPFILVSGAVGEEQAVAVMKAGAHDFVLKHSLFRLGAAVARELREAEVRQERRRAEAALKLLADISTLVTTAPEYHAVLQGAVRLVVPALADRCIVYSITAEHPMPDVIEVAYGEGVDPDALRALAHRYRPSYPPAPYEDHLIALALRTRKAALASEITEDVVTRLAPDEAHRRLLRELGARSMMALPLLGRGHLLGLWIFAATKPGRYTDADLALAEEMGGRVALMAENARLSHAREEFISTAVHEIKTPISVVKTAVQLMQHMTPEQRDARLPDVLIRLDRQCNRLTRLVTNVLEVTRLELKTIELQRRPTELAALVEQVVADMKGLSSSHRLIVTRNDSVTVDVDTERIEQVLTNLIDNAVKYSPGGGDIEVALRRQDDNVVASVRDHGIGVPADRQDRIFELFYRAHAGTPYGHVASLGVGLYLSREFVTRHGGRMWFESREGAGSTFYFSLPMAMELLGTQLAPHDGRAEAAP